MSPIGSRLSIYVRGVDSRVDLVTHCWQCGGACDQHLDGPQGDIVWSICPNVESHSVWASQGKMELTLGVCVGSSIQIAVGVRLPGFWRHKSAAATDDSTGLSQVIPILVIIAWPMGRDLTLYFEVR